MQIENFNFKKGHIQVAEETSKKGIIRLKEYDKPFYVFGKTKEKIKELKEGDVVSIIKKDGVNFNWLLPLHKSVTLYTPDGSQKKYIWLTKVEERYENGFFAQIGNRRIFFNTNKELKKGDNVFVELFEHNQPTFIGNYCCVVPNNIYG